MSASTQPRAAAPRRLRAPHRGSTSVSLAFALTLAACNATMPTLPGSSSASAGSAGASKDKPGFFETLLASAPTAAGPAALSAPGPNAGAGNASGSGPGKSASGKHVAELAKDSTRPERDGIAEAGTKTAAKVLDQDEIKKMLVRADPAACSATQDASGAEMLETWKKLAAASLGGLADAKLFGNDKALQAKLDELKPVMRQLARNTTWLPQSAERMIGEQIAKFNKLETFTPKKTAHKRLLADVITPIFEDLQRFAKDELQSDLEFEMRLYVDPVAQAPKMISGGILLVPSAMFESLAAVHKPDVLVAFLFAHEFSHALRRHTTKKVQMTLIDSIMLAREFRQLYDADKSGWQRLRGGLAANFEFRAQSVTSLVDQACKAKSWLPLMEQGQEYEADVCGALLLDRAGKTRGQTFSAVEGFNQYLEAGLASAADGPKAPVTALQARFKRCMVDADHPSPDDRKANLQTYTLALRGGGNTVNIDLTQTATAEPKGPGAAAGKGRDGKSRVIRIKAETGGKTP